MKGIEASALPRHLVQTYQSYAFAPVDERAGFAYDTAAEWAACAAHFADVLEAGLATLNDPALVAQERETIRKGMVCWRDKGQGSLVVSDAALLLRNNLDQALSLRSRFVRMGGEYAALVRNAPRSVLTELMWGAEVPINKGKGAPTWHPGSDKTSAIALAAVVEGSSTAARMIEAVRTAASATLPIMITSYMRIQATDKVQPLWTMSGGRLQITGTRKGVKTRRVQALSFVMNYLVSQVAPVLRWCLKKRTSRNSGRIAEAQAAVRQYRYSAAVDLSAYDDSVGVETLRMYRELVLVPVYSALRYQGLLTSAEMGILLDLDSMIQSLPLLAPPDNPLFGAMLFPRHGGIVSGERLTSQKGTDINRERIDAKAHAVGMVGSFFNAGDDTIVCTDDRAALDRYLALTKHDGFTETVGADLAFLMRRLPQGYAYLARMTFNTLNRERSHEPNSYALAAAGIAIRRELLIGHPLAHLYDVCLKTSPSPRLRAAAYLSTASSVYDLLLAATTTSARRSDDTTSLEQETELALETGLLGQEQHSALLQRLTALEARSVMRFGELRSEARELGASAGARYIQSTAYTTIKQRSRK